MSPRRLAIGGCAALVVATAGCPGTLEDPGSFLLALEDDSGTGGGSSAGLEPDGGCPDVPQLFVATCTSSSCHSASNKAQGLDLQSPDVAARLVGVSATEGTGLLVDPSSPSKSILYLKLTSSPPFGARMPLGESSLSGAALACVYEWMTSEVSSPAPEAGANEEAGAHSDGGDE